MIGPVMAEINKHFVRTRENLSLSFDAEEKTIAGAFKKRYLPGQYICIRNSYLNDGVYKITAVAEGVLTVSESLNAEESRARVYGLNPPKEFLLLVTDIQNYQSKDGVKSESIDDYSVTFTGDGSWKSAFAGRLNAYRSIYNDLEEGDLIGY